MKILGHPVHMILIHFPSALLPMDFVCSALAFYTGDSNLAYTSFYCMIGGVIFGALAIIAGILDLIGIAEDQPAALRKALIHGGINTSVIIGYSLIAFIAFKNYPAIVSDDLSKIIVKGSLIAFMMVGNYLGGSLILKDKVGIHK
jgi:uncharacterized membrane protein